MNTLAPTSCITRSVSAGKNSPSNITNDDVKSHSSVCARARVRQYLNSVNVPVDLIVYRVSRIWNHTSEPIHYTNVKFGLYTPTHEHALEYTLIRRHMLLGINVSNIFQTLKFQLQYVTNFILYIIFYTFIILIILYLLHNIRVAHGCAANCCITDKSQVRFSDLKPEWKMTTVF